MTLTKTPCELDSMSLFQDLKLKRRKVDSRCSSDGESVADTSTSSPDMVGPASPSPALRDRASPDSALTEGPRQHSIKEEDAEEVRGGGDHSVFDGGGETSPAAPAAPAAPPPLRPAVIHSPAFWMSPCRINGVRPELIGGGLARQQPHQFQQPAEMKPPSASPSPSRPAPTVIMGEAGGVRTMIWSQPDPVQQQQQQQQQPQQAPPQHAASTSTSSWSTSSSSGSSEESAAQMLLNLGQEQPPQPFQRPFASPLNMERLWAGDLSQLPVSHQAHALNLSWSNGGEDAKALVGLHHPLPPPQPPQPQPQQLDEQDDDDQPMICMICEDKATGLHYGIITCEGCKGFFKRTVQNRRVYTCVADGNCEITKAQRNRCQYCRFKKCIEQGMVLQAVREDRMPGGRNSGAVYNLYKV